VIEEKEEIVTSIYFSILEYAKLVNVQWRQILHDGCNSNGCALCVTAKKSHAFDSDLCNSLNRETVGQRRV
jgi:hypothetical protein